jgi:hypothetical protein
MILLFQYVILAFGGAKVGAGPDPLNAILKRTLACRLGANCKAVNFSREASRWAGAGRAGRLVRLRT